MNLPELPKGECAIDYGGLTIVYDAEALRAYAEEAVKQEREAIAERLTSAPAYPGNDWGEGYTQALKDVAEAILSRTAVPAKE